ncbi:MAG: SRPBCC family protein [Meiothermus sp.]|nr:SRPBCC family protein [Meiothermus sp.]
MQQPTQTRNPSSGPPAPGLMGDGGHQDHPPSALEADQARDPVNTLRHGANRWVALGGLVLLAGAALWASRKARESAYTGSYSPAGREKQHRERGISFERAVTVMKSPEELYTFWRRLENLPQFMSHLEEVRPHDGRRSSWRAKVAGETEVSWEAEITEDIPNRRIAWRSLEGSEIPTSGHVSFESLPNQRGTVVRVFLNYQPAGGPVADALAKLFGKSPEQMIAADLRRFQQLMEAGEIATTEGQPVGRGQEQKDGRKLEGSTT